MFDVELRFLVGGRAVGLDGFLDAVVERISRAVVEQPRQEDSEEEQKAPKRLAVGMNEAAKMLGISSRTLALYVSQKRIRVVRFGRRVLVPMRILERAAVEGVPK